MNVSYLYIFHRAVKGNAWSKRKQNAVCRILPSCAKLRLLWQPESGPVPVAMVERDWVMTLLVRQQNVSAISSPGCDSAGNIYYQCKAELFLPSAWVCDLYYLWVSGHWIHFVRVVYRCREWTQRVTIRTGKLSHGGKNGTLLSDWFNLR